MKSNFISLLPVSKKKHRRALRFHNGKQGDRTLSGLKDMHCEQR
jgi:hypothetical protein